MEGDEISSTLRRCGYSRSQNRSSPEEMNGRVSMGMQIRKTALLPEMLGDSDKCSIDEDSDEWFKQFWTNVRVLLSETYADFEEGIC